MMRKKIKITRRQYNVISKLYRFGGFAAIVGLLAGFSALIGKPIEFLLIFFPYFITKNFYAKQYHAKSLKDCFAMSFIVFAMAILACAPSGISIMFAGVTGLTIAFISHKAGVIQFKLKDYKYIEPRYNYLLEFYNKANERKTFNTDTCTEQELRNKCKDLHLSLENTELAVEFFIVKTKQSVIADRLCIDEKSVTTRKKRLKDKLNNFN